MKREIFTKILLERDFNTIIRNSRRSKGMIIDFLELHKDELKGKSLDEIIRLLKERDFFIEVGKDKYSLCFDTAKE